MNEKILGNDFIVYDWKESDNKIIIYVKATSHDDVCPVCGSPTSSLHNTYHRMIQAYPVRNKTTFIDVIAYKYDCTNDKCNRKVIMQNLPFVSPSLLISTLYKQKKTGTNQIKLINIKNS